MIASRVPGPNTARIHGSTTCLEAPQGSTGLGGPRDHGPSQEAHSRRDGLYQADRDEACLPSWPPC